ncbi:MAG: hypothetical protein JW936_01720 [Sedimentisphaerales bacterium]|nr:hypothetical protein [Sedimentisphaerales bacterium]
MSDQATSRFSGHSCIGIHYSGSAATAVVVDTHHGDRAVEAKVRVVSPNPQAKAENVAELLDEIVEKLSLDAKRQLPVALALGGQLYQTGEHHSEFSDPRQIDQTLRFDVEEEFMVDAESVALCYQVKRSDENGADLIVSLTPRDELAELFEQFYNKRLDAHIAQPDLTAWISYLRQYAPEIDKNVVCVAWTEGVLYTLLVDASYNPILSRSYLCPDASSAHDVLEREMRRADVLLSADQRAAVLLYHSDHFNGDRIKQLADSLGLGVQALPHADAAEAFAIGAALSWAEGKVFTDFRREDMQPKTLVAGRLKALYGLSAAITILLLAWALIMYSQASAYRGAQEKNIENIKTVWQEVHSDERMRDSSNIAQLARSIRVLRSEVALNAQGQSDSMTSNSAARVVYLVLQALDRLPQDFDLQLESINAGTDYARISGFVPTLADRAEMDAVIEAQSELTLSNWDMGQDSSGEGRRSFNMSLEVAAAGTP